MCGRGRYEVTCRHRGLLPSRQAVTPPSRREARNALCPHRRGLGNASALHRRFSSFICGDGGRFTRRQTTKAAPYGASPCGAAAMFSFCTEQRQCSHSVYFGAIHFSAASGTFAGRLEKPRLCIAVFLRLFAETGGTFHTQADNKSRPDGASPCGAAAMFSFCAFRRGSFLRRIRDFCRGGGGVSFCAERHGWRAGVRAIPVRFIFPSAPGPLPGRAASSAPRRGISGGGVSDRTTGSSAPPERRRRHRSDPYREY